MECERFWILEFTAVRDLRRWNCRIGSFDGCRNSCGALREALGSMLQRLEGLQDLDETLSGRSSVQGLGVKLVSLVFGVLGSGALAVA